MPKFKLEIDLSNAAFDEDPDHELYRILRKVASDARDGMPYDRQLPVKDENGNTVGHYSIEREPVWPNLRLGDM